MEYNRRDEIKPFLFRLLGGPVSLESRFQSHLIEELEYRFPGCFILKNDANLIQGIPDLMVLYKNKWAMLEVKASHSAAQQPNQEYYVELFHGMSFAAFIFPENEEEVLSELQQTFQPRRSTRASVR